MKEADRKYSNTRIVAKELQRYHWMFCKLPFDEHKRPAATRPNTIRHMTIGEDQGCVTPPKSRPNRNMKVAPIIVMLPSQSIAWIPVISGVFAVWDFKVSTVTRNAPAVRGTSREQSDHEYLISFVNQQHVNKLLTVNIETPPPGRLFCKEATSNGTNGGCQSPYDADNSKELRSTSERK